MQLIQIHPRDNVAVALRAIAIGETIEVPTGALVALEAIQSGHKIALANIEEGQPVIKYGCPIGATTRAIEKGTFVHTHNLRTRLDTAAAYAYEPAWMPLPAVPPRSFQGYLRADGSAATRNELWVIPTVGCVNGIAHQIAAQNQALVAGTIEGLYAFPHPFGCSQMGRDHEMTRRLLAALARHPNAGGVLVLGLGCENNTMREFQAELGEWDPDRVQFLVCQEVEDEFDEAARMLQALATHASQARRETLPVSKLVVGMKCGGSDGLSGVTANPVVGAFSDRLIAQGGTTILTEVPEMFGAEDLLMRRCESRQVFNKTVQMIEGFKDYFTGHGQVVYENPSPGNKAGGITTLEEKSCGCVQKGGDAPIVDVIDYGQAVTKPGLNLLNGPGNDLVSTTALTAAGAHLILFTTGRGTPFGAPVPTLKVATNHDLATHKRGWIDFDASAVAAGEAVDEVGARLFACVIACASGQPTKSELQGCREISIWKDGVVL